MFEIRTHLLRCFSQEFHEGILLFQQRRFTRYAVAQQKAGHELAVQVFTGLDAGECGGRKTTSIFSDCPSNHPVTGMA